ncbi:MAG: acetyl-CoA carboxylase carboxyltransferase subunit alpha [Chloroflexota bacterium]
MPINLPFRPRRTTYPPDLWTKCPGCGEMLFNKQLDKVLRVCPSCGHHFRLPARARLEQLLDPGTWQERDAGLQSVDPLGFVDSKPYPDRLAAAQMATGLRDAAVWGTGAIDGQPVAICVMDFGFMGGSMGSVVGEKVTRAAEGALAERLPLVIVSASGGARMQEGTLALMQLVKTLAAIERLKAAGVPYLSVLSDPTTGGVFASFAAVGDVNIAEPNALIGFAGARVSAGTIAQELPPGFQRSEFLFAHGFLDRVVPRAELRHEIGALLRYLVPAGATPAWIESPAAAPFRPLSFLSALAERVVPESHAGPTGNRDGATGEGEQPADAQARVWARVQLARHLRRPRTLELLATMADEFVELHGDRCFGDDPAIVAGLARIDGRRVVVVGHQKGSDTEENIRRNFGMPHPEGYRKAIRIMDLAERFGLPVVSLIDVPGAHPGPESEERGIAEAIARSVGLMTRLRTPIVAVITGEGGSGGALAIAVGDVVVALENAVYSVISPEGCASILWRTPDQAPAAALAMRMTAADQQELGVVDIVVPEPGEGAHTDHAETARRLRSVVLEQLEALSGPSIDELLDLRYARYRTLGAFTEVSAPPVAPTGRPGLAGRLRALIEAGRQTLGAPLPSGLFDTGRRPRGEPRIEPPAREEV